jgi:hypothetical protein
VVNIGGRLPLNECRHSKHIISIFVVYFDFDNNNLHGLVPVPYLFGRLSTIDTLGTSIRGSPVILITFVPFLMTPLISCFIAGDFSLCYLHHNFHPQCFIAWIAIICMCRCIYIYIYIYVSLYFLELCFTHLLSHTTCIEWLLYWFTFTAFIICGDLTQNMIRTFTITPTLPRYPNQCTYLTYMSVESYSHQQVFSIRSNVDYKSYF